MQQLRLSLLALLPFWRLFMILFDAQCSWTVEVVDALQRSSTPPYPYPYPSGCEDDMTTKRHGPRAVFPVRCWTNIM